MSVPQRVGRITINERGEIIGSSVEHLRDGDLVRIEDRDGNLLYTSRFSWRKFQESFR